MNDIVIMFLACALATYLTRIGGYLILSRFGTINHRVEAALDATPVAVLTALVAPSLISRGPAESLALVVAGLVAMRLSLTFTVVLGLIAVVGLRTVF